MGSRSKILMVLGVIGTLIAFIMFVRYHNAPEATYAKLFGLTQLLLGSA